MKTSKYEKLLSLTLLSAIAATTAWSPVASAGGTGIGLIGGLIAGHVLTDYSNRDKQRTQDMNEMAYQQQRASNAQPAAAASGGGSMSPEARIKQLDKLAAGGYITPAEYKAKKKAILASM